MLVFKLVLQIILVTFAVFQLLWTKSTLFLSCPVNKHPLTVFFSFISVITHKVRNMSVSTAFMIKENKE